MQLSLDPFCCLQSEPFYELEDFDGRAPFLPFSVDENVIMWSPSLEFEDAPDYNSDNSSTFSGSNKCSGSPVNSPNSVSSATAGAEDSSFYLPDGSLNISALRHSDEK